LKQLQRKWTYVLAVSLACLLFASACSSNNKANNSAASGSPSTSPSGSQSVAPSDSPQVTPTLTIAMQSNPLVEDFKTNYLTKYIEQHLNVNLEFVELPSKADEAITKLTLMVTSGEKLPDVINMRLGADLVLDFSSKGVLLPLDEYVNDEKVAPFLNALPVRDMFVNQAKDADGKLYGMPALAATNWDAAPYRVWINKEWLDKLQLQMPRTTDEFYEVLKAFTQNDPNGNKKKDEIGVVGGSGWGLSPRIALMNPFINTNPEKNYLVVRDGQLIPAYTQPEWKKGLEYMHQLVKDGLLSPLSFTQDETQFKALINVEGGMAGVLTAASPSQIPENIKDVMVLVPPLQGPDGKTTTTYNPVAPAPNWYVTKDAADPALAVKVADFFYNEETAITARFGEKGVEWSDDPAITQQYASSNPELGYKVDYAVIDHSIWSNPQNKHWRNVNPSYFSPDMLNNRSLVKKEDYDPNAYNYQADFENEYVPHFPKEFIYSLKYNSDELTQIADSRTAIINYVSSSAVEFIMGNRPFSDWDKYLNELNKMGLEQYMKVTQAMYDRTK